MKYKIKATGKSPYRKKVTVAPSRVPLLLVASATLIMTTTYNQAIGIMYIGFTRQCSRVCQGDVGRS
jgi:hypothetical protein